MILILYSKVALTAAKYWTELHSRCMTLGIKLRDQGIQCQEQTAVALVITSNKQVQDIWVCIVEHFSRKRCTNNHKSIQLRVLNHPFLPIFWRL